MRSFFEKVILFIVCFCVCPLLASAQGPISVGSFYEFSILGATNVVNTGSTVVNASLGVTTGTITGFPPGIVVRDTHDKDALALQAKQDAQTAFTEAAGRTNTSSYTNYNLGGRTLSPGVYELNGSSTLLSGELVLDGENNPNSVFIFKVKGLLDIANNALVTLKRDAASAHVYWIIDGDMITGKSASLKGNFLAQQHISLGDATTIQGRLAALGGQVTLINNQLNMPADLEITLQKTPGVNGINRYVVGETITYTIKIKNNGPVNEDNVQVTDLRLSGVVTGYNSSIAGTTLTKNADDSWVWNVGHMDYNTEATLTITVTIDKPGPGFIRGFVGGASIDELRNNNAADLSFCIVLADAGTITGPTKLCVGNTATYSIEPIEGVSKYTWNVPIGWTYTYNGNSITVVAGVGEGAITVTANNTCGESLPSRLAVSTFPGPPAKPGVISGSKEVCVGSSVTYSIADVDYATSYEWILPQGWTKVSDSGTSITVMPGGTNTVKTIQVKAINMCGASQVSTLEVQPFLTVPAATAPITGINPVCSSRAAATYSIISQSDATTYFWEVPSTWEIISGQGTISITVKPTSEAGAVTVKAGNSCGYGPVTSFSITPVTSVPPAPGAILGSPAACLGSSNQKYSIEPVSTASSYIWYVPAGWTITAGQGTNEITVSLSATASQGKITVQAQNDCGVGASKSLDVSTLQAAPATPLAIKGTAYGCANSTFTYETDPVATAQNYTWAVPDDWRILSGQGTTKVLVLIGSKPGNISVRASNSCGASANKSMMVTPFISPPIQPYSIDGAADVCVGQQGVVYTLNPVDNTLEYIWAVPTGWTITSGQGTTTITVSVGTSEGYITVSASNDCGASTPASLKVTPSNTAPPMPTSISGELRVCTGQQGLTYSVAPVPGASAYIWEVPAGSGWRITAGQGTRTITVSAGTTAITLKVIALNGCGKESPAQTAAIVFKFAPMKPAIIAGEIKPCVGKAVTFNIAAVIDATSYTWEVPTGWEIIGGKNGTSLTVIPNATAGKVRVMASNNCGVSTFQELDVTPATGIPAAPAAIIGNLDACVGSIVTYKVNAVAEARSYQWEVPQGWTIESGQGTTTITAKVGAVGGTIKVTAENACGIGSSTTQALTTSSSIPAKPGIITGAIEFCVGTTQIYSIEAVSGAIAYQWKFPADYEIVSGQGTTTVTVKAGKTAGQVTVIASNGCGINTSNALTVVPTDGVPPTPGAITNNNGKFCQNTAGLVFSIANVTSATSYVWTVPQGWVITDGQGTTRITVTASTTNGEVTVAASNLCGVGTSTTLATGPQQPLAAPGKIEGPAAPCNRNSEATYFVPAMDGVDKYIWTLPTGWTIKSGDGTNKITVIVVGEGGVISVKANNVCGASPESSRTVTTVGNEPAAPISINGTTKLCATHTTTYNIQSSATASSYTWVIPPGWEIVEGQGTTQLTVKVGTSSGEISVTADNGCGSSRATLLVVATVPVATISSIRDLTTPCRGLSYEVNPADNARIYNWTVPEGWVITSGQGTTTISVIPGPGKGQIKVFSNNGTCDSDVASITPDLELLKSVVIFPDVFSPNNDGINDTWEVTNILNYTDNDITILNRWGSEVYRSKSYKNDWTGDNLTEGTYYYIARVKLCNGTEKVFKGFVMIVR
ncbi:ice-binding family protein [Pontibacter vulgaris]|uniref:ice-binding family protein n=1 Tax=Pontibacter vulgaris TaxID=2905679 RepID=UPI001FA791DE|nr:ice-binding family protein [Pontibacter vulgaris]